MPPFYYYNFSKESEEYMIKSLCKRKTYKTALEEYKFTHTDSIICELANAIDNNVLGSIPVKVITHSSNCYIKELQEYGNMNFDLAHKIENTWQEIMKKTLNISNNSEHIIAENSGHYIHLTNSKCVIDAINNLTKTKECNLYNGGFVK